VSSVLLTTSRAMWAASPSSTPAKSKAKHLFVAYGLVTGMKLPNALSAVVQREKVVDYLLNQGHRYGASKAEFFLRYGFLLEKWEVLAQALLEHGQKHDVVNVTETVFWSALLDRRGIALTRWSGSAHPDSLAIG
jgi:hypothetical protein